MKITNELLTEEVKRFLKEEEKKGGVKKKTSKSPKGFENFDLGISEIMSILSIGTDSKKISKTSLNAVRNYLRSYGFAPEYTSAKSLAESFRVFDLNSEEIKKLKCSSLGGLVSKYAIISGLVSIMEQFNAQAGGFVNEAFISLLLGGDVVAAGAGGIEDLVVGSGNQKIGISLKTKKTAKIGGSLLNLVETLNIPTFIQTRGEKQAASILAGKRKGRAFKTTQIEPHQIPNRKNPVILMNPLRDPGSLLDVLYYLIFKKDETKLTVYTAKITKEDIVEGVGAIEIGGVLYYDFNKLNNILKQKPSEINVKDKFSMPLDADYSLESFNKSLAESAKDVFSSLSILDQWFGGLKDKISGYVSTLEESSFNEMQNHMKSGQGFMFNAFDMSACDREEMTENKIEKLTEETLDKMIQRVILESK